MKSIILSTIYFYISLSLSISLDMYIISLSLSRIVIILHLQRNMKYEYEWMNIPFTLDEQKVKNAYRKCALRHHPDKGGTLDNFRKTQCFMEKITANLNTLRIKHPEAF